MPNQRSLTLFWSRSAKPQRYWVREILMPLFTALNELRQRSEKAHIEDYDYLRGHTGAWADVKELLRKSNKERP